MFTGSGEDLSVYHSNFDWWEGHGPPRSSNGFRTISVYSLNILYFSLKSIVSTSSFHFSKGTNYIYLVFPFFPRVRLFTAVLGGGVLHHASYDCLSRYIVTA